jgi:twitching motility protein PilU
MQTFDTSLYNLVVEGIIAESESLKHADSVNDLRLRLKLYADSSGDASRSSGEWELLE